MAERANDEILQLAGQGNLQALSVYLNRHLIPSGAHVKVKQKDEALHVLIVVMRDTDHSGLIQSVQQLLIRLKPDHIKRVKVYTQVLGQKQATLRQQFSLGVIPEPPPKTSSPAVGYSNPAPRQQDARPTFSGRHNFVSPPSTAESREAQKASKPHSSSNGNGSASVAKKRRYSVAEFLSQATNIEDLAVLHNHPFFTGSCPHCHYVFPATASPPTYWDCPKCGWRDDLSAVIPRSNRHSDHSQISLTESKRLGDYLTEAGLLTVSQVEVALADQATTGLRFGEVLVRRGWLKAETIEYLMQKIVMPERVGQHNAVYLESSRNLLKALFKVTPASAAERPLLPPSSPQPSAAPAPALENHGASAPSKITPVQSGKLANERETLILPDIELDELDAYLNGSSS